MFCLPVIGKGGEQIAAIQSETGCKVQFAPDSAGMPDRPCTLTGSDDSIRSVNARQKAMYMDTGYYDSEIGCVRHLCFPGPN